MSGRELGTRGSELELHHSAPEGELRHDQRATGRRGRASRHACVLPLGCHDREEVADMATHDMTRLVPARSGELPRSLRRAV